MLRGVCWWLVTEVSGKYIQQAVEHELFTDSLNLKYDRCCPETSVTSFQPSPRNMQEEQRPRPHCGESLKSIQLKRTIICIIKMCSMEALQTAFYFPPIPTNVERHV